MYCVLRCLSVSIQLRLWLYSWDSVYFGRIRNPACQLFTGPLHPRWCRISSINNSVPACVHRLCRLKRSGPWMTPDDTIRTLDTSSNCCIGISLLAWQGWSWYRPEQVITAGSGSGGLPSNWGFVVLGVWSENLLLAKMTQGPKCSKREGAKMRPGVTDL